MDGSIFAYAVSYDWSKGAEAHNPASAQNNIFLHATQACVTFAPCPDLHDRTNSDLLPCSAAGRGAAKAAQRNDHKALVIVLCAVEALLLSFDDPQTTTTATVTHA